MRENMLECEFSNCFLWKGISYNIFALVGLVWVTLLGLSLAIDAANAILIRTMLVKSTPLSAVISTGSSLLGPRSL